MDVVPEAGVEKQVGDTGRAAEKVSLLVLINKYTFLKKKKKVSGKCFINVEK